MAFPKPRGLQGWLMFGLIVAVVMAVIFRWPQARAIVTGQ
jgi:hypothetical protein